MHKTFHLLAECEDQVGEEHLHFFQGVVLNAQDLVQAELRASELFARRGARLVAFDEEETREVDPATVRYEERPSEEGVLALSGRVWVEPRAARGGLFAVLRRLLGGG